MTQRLLSFALALHAAGVPNARLQAQAREHAWVTLLGADTLGVERITTGDNSLTGVIQMRGQPRVEWRLQLARPGFTTSVSLAAFRNAEPDAPVLQRATITLIGDSARAELIGAAGKPVVQSLPGRGDAILLVNGSVAGLELALLRATPGTSSTVPIFLTTGGRVVEAQVRLTGDSGAISLLGMEYLIRQRDGRLIEVSLPRQNLRMLRVEGAGLRTLSAGKPDYSAPAGAPYIATDVSIPAGPHTIAGTLTMPSGAPGRTPVVVTITGSGPQDRDSYIPIVPGYRPFRQLADTLGRRGVAVLRYDERGSGASGGSFQGSSSADFAADVAAVVRWLRARPDIDPDKVFLAGHSEGGLVAPMVAERDPKLAGIVLLAGTARNGRDIINFQLRYAVEHDSSLATPARRDSALRAGDSTFKALEQGDPWFRFFLSYDPIPTARRVKVPVLVVQGATDRQVTADQAGMLVEALRAGGNRDVTELMLPDYNHLFLHDPSGTPANYYRLPSGRIGPEVLGPITEWIVTRGRR